MTMNFHPSDYLNDLNIEFDNISPPATEQNVPSSNDLYMFSQSEFLDLDVFARDSALQSKEVSVKLESVPETIEEPIQRISAQTPVLPTDYAEAESTAHLASSADDKRKRNTAASARFRIKKKMKEQQMVQQSKELQEKVQSLEKKLKTLEMENKCLKNLMAQRSDKKDSDWLEQIKKRSMLDNTTPFQYTN